LSDVDVCAIASQFTHVTFDPRATRTSFGPNAKLLITTIVEPGT
jgi:hypothetical protein